MSFTRFADLLTIRWMHATVRHLTGSYAARLTTAVASSMTRTPLLLQTVFDWLRRSAYRKQSAGARAVSWLELRLVNAIFRRLKTRQLPSTVTQQRILKLSIKPAVECVQPGMPDTRTLVASGCDSWSRQLHVCQTSSAFTNSDTTVSYCDNFRSS